MDISPTTQARLMATARAEGLSVDAFIARLIDEREEWTAAVEQAAGHLAPLSQEETQVKIERGFLQSERGDLVDGEVFTAGLLGQIDEMERTRHLG